MDRIVLQFIILIIVVIMSNKLIGQDWGQLEKIVASDRGSEDLFAHGVSISGDYAIVGAYCEDHDVLGTNELDRAGSAYIFKRNGFNWEFQQKIVASDRAVEDRFGYSVSISGDYAIVGAYGEDHDVSGYNVLNFAGSAYIYKRTGETWSQQQKIVASDRGISDLFGYSVAISGNYVIVGAFAEDHDTLGGNEFLSAGAAYIFERTGETWSQQQKIIASDRGSKDYFGHSVSISGDYAIVGAYNEEHNAVGEDSLSVAGSAYIYKRVGETWSQQQKIVASDRSSDDNFGYSVSISSDSAIVGAYGENHDVLGNNELNNSGSAYIYVKTGETWVQQQKIVASDRSVDDYFGYSVAISGVYAIVGAYYEDHNISGEDSLFSAGSAYIFATGEALAVELRNFDIKVINNKALLHWETVTEKNNYGFKIERAVLGEKKSFEKIGFVAGHGNSNLVRAYSYIDSMPLEGRAVYRLKQIDFDGKYEYSEEIEVTSGLVKEYSLEQNYPNPFNPTTNISFKLAKKGKVNIKIFNAIGQEVAELVNKTMEGGSYEVTFNAANLPSGVYFCRMNAGGFTKMTKLLLIK